MTRFSTIKRKCTNMTEREMFEKSFQRPTNYFKLSGQEQWDIDARLGILDWEGTGLSKEDNERFQNHYKTKRVSNVVKQSEIKTYPKINNAPNYDDITRENMGDVIDLMVFLKKHSYSYNCSNGKLGYITIINPENPEGGVRYQIESKLFDYISHFNH